MIDLERQDKVESLAAFLHSGSDTKSTATDTVQHKNEKAKAAPSPSVKATGKDGTVKNRPAPQKTSKDELKLTSDKNDSNDDDLSAILFSLDKKKKENKARNISGEKETPANTASERKAPANPTPERKAPVKPLPVKEAQAKAASKKEEISESEKNDEVKPYYKNTGNIIHYDTAATKMMDISTAQKVQSKSIPANPALPVDDIVDDEADETEEEDIQQKRELSEARIRYEKQRQTTRTFAYILLGAFLSVVIVGASAYLSSYIVTFALDLTGIATNEFNIDVIIPEEADIDVVAAILQENNIIKSPKFFKFFGDVTNKSDRFYSGTYTLSSTMSYMTIFSTLQSVHQENKIITLRIVEGMTAAEIAQLLEENKVCYAADFEKYYRNIQNFYDFERRLSEQANKFNQLEGYLFPDTYEFYAVLDTVEIEYETEEEKEEAEKKQRERELDNAEEAAKKMFKNFNDKITKQMYKKMGEMNMTLDEVIAVASMVQKEAADTDDMYLVASVFLNRIRNSEEFPYLQSDVTALYVENDIKPYLTNNTARYKRLNETYNTYVCKGIPAGPICNPGLDAIDAVLNAADTDYFYFCANEETGEVFYAKTHEEHEANLILAGIT